MKIREGKKWRKPIGVEIDKLRPGMRVAKMVENQLGAVLLTPGMILDENIIMKLQRMGIPEVVIYNETDKRGRRE